MMPGQLAIPVSHGAERSRDDQGQRLAGAATKPMLKDLDFVKSGGPKQTILRTFRWEVVF